MVDDDDDDDGDDDDGDELCELESASEGSKKRQKIKKATMEKKKVKEGGEESETIVVFHNFGNESKFVAKLIEQLGPEYVGKIVTYCWGMMLRLLSGRRGNGTLKGGPSKYPQSMSCMTFAICQREEFKHTAESDAVHQAQCMRAMIRAYALRLKG